MTCPICQKKNEQKIKQISKNLSIQFKQKWNQVFRTKSKFIIKNKLWLDRYIILPCCSGKGGRPKEIFNNLSYSGKYKRTEHLRKFETHELLFASKMGLRTDGKSQVAKKLQTIEIESNTARIR